MASMPIYMPIEDFVPIKSTNQGVHPLAFIPSNRDPLDRGFSILSR
jgi:hypothetical protein